MNRKKMILIALLGVLALALLYAFWASPEQQRVTTSVAEPPAKKTATSTDNVTKKKVKVELLDKDYGTFKGIQRNLFGDLYPRPKVVKPAPPSPKPVVVKPPPKPAVKAPTPVEVVRRELARFTFMGYLRKQDSWTIFLSSRDEIFLVKEGDRFGPNNQFHAVEITPEQLVINQATQGRIEIPLVEKQPLVPSSLPAASNNLVPSRSAQRPVFDTSAPQRVPVRNVRPFRSNPFGSNVPNVPPTSPQPTQTPTPTDTSNEVSDE